MFRLKLPQRFPRQRLRKLFHEFVPRDGHRAIVLPYHRDAVVDRTDEETQRASDAIRLANLGLVLPVMGNQIDALMRTIFACDVAQIALDTFRFIDLRDRLCQKVQVAEVGDALE